MRQRRRTATALTAAVAALTMAGLTGCAAPAYTYAADTSDHAFFKVPASWQPVGAQTLADVQSDLLDKLPAGSAGGAFTWSRAYAEYADPGGVGLLAGSRIPVVYASVQNLRDSLRAGLSFEAMQDVLYPVSSDARQLAAEEGDKFPGFKLIYNHTITASDGVRGINELYEFDVGGEPDAFDQTVLTNGPTTKMYLLLVQCYQSCFVSNEAQIEAIVDSFTVRGS